LIRAIGALSLAMLLPALSGCSLFGGGDDKEEKKGEALMDASTGASTGAAPMPGAVPEIAEERGPSNAFPILALVVSGITLISLIVHSRRHRRKPDASW
jgi:hypothetical protein